MASTFSCTLMLQFTAQETLDSSDAPAASSDKRLTHDGFNIAALTLNASSTPDVEKVAYFTKTLSGGAATIDLTALSHNGQTVDMTGKKLRAIMVKFASTNVGSLNIAPGASNGYDLFGASNDITIPAQTGTLPGVVLMTCGDSAPAVAAGDKNIDLTGTGTESFQFGMWFG